VAFYSKNIVSVEYNYYIYNKELLVITRDKTRGKISEFNSKVRALRRVLFLPPPNTDLSDIIEIRYSNLLEISS